jgi:hypothetical protein
MTSISDMQCLEIALEEIGGTRGMWRLLKQIYDIAGLNHALATLRGWGWKP